MYKNVYVIGVFDLFHRGHIEFLKKSKALGEQLIVAVNSDTKVLDYKRKPIYNETDRLEIVKACRFVDEAFIITGYNHKEYIQKYSIDAIVHGNDWEKESYMRQLRLTQADLEAFDTKLLLVPYTQGVSTSEYIKRIQATNDVREHNKQASELR